jgi:carbonic anhydrase
MNVGGMLALSIGCAMGQPTPPTWTHNPAAQNGPLHWGNVTPSYETCGNAPMGLPSVVQVGMAQTPVNIVTANKRFGTAAANRLPVQHYSIRSGEHGARSGGGV